MPFSTDSLLVAHNLFYAHPTETERASQWKRAPNAMRTTILENIYMWNKCHTLPIITILLKLCGTQYFPLKRTRLTAARKKSNETTLTRNGSKYTENCSETSLWPRELYCRVAGGGEDGRVLWAYFLWIFLPFFFITIVNVLIVPIGKIKDHIEYNCLFDLAQA